MAAAKIRWGELEEDDGGDLDFLLPPRVVIGPDENGFKKTIEYRFDDDGNKVKVTTTTRVRKLARARLSKAAVERRSWSKLGDAASGDDASARLTVVSTEEILLERPRAPGSKADEPSASGDPLAMASKGGAVLMVCRTCGKKGDHWTSKCPYKDLAPAPDTLDRPPTSEGPPALGGGGPAKGSYVAPRLRAGAVQDAGHDMKRRNDENSVVTQRTTAWCSTQVVDITQVKHRSTHITSLRVVQQKHMRVQGMSIEGYINCLQKINTASYFTVR
ncbi:hypothetical protein ACQ4PT_071186 [Festuca glaucescens]